MSRWFYYHYTYATNSSFEIKLAKWNTHMSICFSETVFYIVTVKIKSDLLKTVTSVDI